MKIARLPISAPQLCASPIAEMDRRRLACVELACDRTACRYHVPLDDAHHCALLWAERGGMPERELPAVLGVTRQRAWQILRAAAAKLSVSDMASLRGWTHARGFPEGEVDGVSAEAL